MQHIDWISWILKIVQVGCAPSPEDLSTRAPVLRRRLLGVGLIMLTLGYSPVAHAEDLMGDRAGELLIAASPAPAHPDRLTIPADAAQVPLGSADQAWESLPPPEPPDVPAPPISETAPETAPVAMTLLQTIKAETVAKPVELAFGLSPQVSPQPQAVPAPVSETAASDNPAVPLANLFVGNSDSLVAKAVGSAEGTRTPEGDRNPAYFGHVDPGNKAWNLGSFSYQHEAATPEDADVKQLDRLQDQAGVIQAKAQAKGMALTLEEALNGIDLANQAPKAVLDQDGYVDWLAKAHQNGLMGDDAVLWARTQSFFDPKLQRWNAPGLGNTQDSITHDQKRRMQAIDRAIAVHQPPLVSPVVPPSPQPLPQTATQTATQANLRKISEDIGIARLFAEQAVTPFGGNAIASEGAQPSSASGSAHGLATSAPEREAIASPDPATVALWESPGIAALLNLDLPRS